MINFWQNILQIDYLIDSFLGFLMFISWIKSRFNLHEMENENSDFYFFFPLSCLVVEIVVIIGAHVMGYIYICKLLARIPQWSIIHFCFFFWVDQHGYTSWNYKNVWGCWDSVRYLFALFFSFRKSGAEMELKQTFTCI